jgi:hypothetical protein
MREFLLLRKKGEPVPQSVHGSTEIFKKENPIKSVKEVKGDYLVFYRHFKSK